MLQKLRLGSPIAFPPEASKLEYARCLDEHDSLKHLREEFIIPNASSLKKTALDGSIPRRCLPSPRQARKEITRLICDNIREFNELS